MKLLKLKYSPSFSKISQVLHLQSRHIIVLLLRMNFSRYEYTNKTLVYNFQSLKLCILWTIVNWVAIVFFTFIFFQYLPAYGKIYGTVLGVEKSYHRFSMMATSTFVIAEFTWLTAFIEHYSGKNKALDLVYELSSSLETELSQSEQEKQLRWFNRAQFFIQMHIKQVYAGIAFQVFIVYGLFIKYYLKGEITLLEVPLYMFLCTSSNQMGAFSIVLFSNMINDFFFMINVFKIKLDQCFHLLRCLLSSSVNGHSEGNYALCRFDHQYSELHRQVNMYNAFGRKFIFMCDMIIKIAANVTFTTLLSQGNLSSNTVGLTIMTFYASGYFSLQLLYFMLANFPAQNLLVYKAVCHLNAHQVLALKSTFTSDRSLHSSRSSVKYLLKLNTLIDFLQSNQSFGFTYSVFYLVQKWEIFDNAFYTICLLLLFYKRYI